MCYPPTESRSAWPTFHALLTSFTFGLGQSYVPRTLCPTYSDGTWDGDASGGI